MIFFIYLDQGYGVTTPNEQRKLAIENGFEACPKNGEKGIGGNEVKAGGGRLCSV